MVQVTVKHPGMKKRYVYRLEVEYPPQASDPYWVPEAWQEPYAFYWPRERVFLSITGATNLANRLVELGCRVTIRRSEPVEWFDGKVVREMGELL